MPCRLKPTAVLLALTLAACAREAPTSPVSAVVDGTVALARSGGATPRPFAGTCELAPVAPPIVTPPLVTRHEGGTCRMAHLGHVAFAGVQVVNMVTRTQTADFVLTAANGDELRATNVGGNVSSGPTTIRFAGTTTFVGGTGRFASAHGVAQVTGEADLATGLATLVFDGWLVHDASDARDR